MAQSCNLLGLSYAQPPSNLPYLLPTDLGAVQKSIGLS
jgi:hypothetical protein